MTFVKANRVYYDQNRNKYIESKDTTIINLAHIVTITPEELMEQFRGDVTKPTFRVTTTVQNFSEALVVTSDYLEWQFFTSSPIIQDGNQSGMPEAKET